LPTGREPSALEGFVVTRMLPQSGGRGIVASAVAHFPLFFEAGPSRALLDPLPGIEQDANGIALPTASATFVVALVDGTDRPAAPLVVDAGGFLLVPVRGQDASDPPLVLASVPADGGTDIVSITPENR
jgi:hypothetical protein